MTDKLSTNQYKQVQVVYLFCKQIFKKMSEWISGHKLNERYTLSVSRKMG